MYRPSRGDIRSGTGPALDTLAGCWTSSCCATTRRRSGPRSAPGARTPISSDAALGADERRRAAIVTFERARARAEGARQAGRHGAGRRAGRPAGAYQGPGRRGEGRGRRPQAALAECTGLMGRLSNIVEPGVPAGGEDDYVVLEVGEPPTFDFDPRDHLELGEAPRRDRHRARREGLGRAVLLPDRRRRAAAARRCSTWPMAQAVEDGFTPVITAGAGQAGVDGGHRLPRRHASEVYRLRGDDLYLVGTRRCRSRRTTWTRSSTLDRLPLRYAGWSSCFRREAGSLRQGHPRHHPGAPVRQGRDVLLRRPGGRRGRAPAAARLGGGDAGQGRAALPRDRRGRR